MEKTVYESYGYVETNSEGQFIEPSQFFVVQNDGTLILNKQVQLVTEMADVKHMMDNTQSVQPCPMYHMSQQQEYFVNVNHTEFMLPEASVEEPGTENYANILQQTQGNSTDQIPPHMVVDDLKTFASNAMIKPELNQIPQPVSGPIIDNTENSCTEITLNDEQWRMMQKKGWLLLEISDKIFLLDTLGLHDITENEELIQKLRSENVASNFIANNESSMPSVNLNENELQIDTPMFSSDTCGEQSQNDHIIEEKDVNMVEAGPQQVAETKCQVNSEYSDSKVDLCNTPAAENSPKSNHNDQNSGTVVRLITNYSLKDIPKKMVLGKTSSGKNLIAKVVSVKKKPIQNESTTVTPSSPNPPSAGATLNTDSSTVSQFENVSKHELGKVDGIVRQFLSLSKQTMCSSEDVHAAKAVITQLLNVPTTRQPLLGRNLILTKIVKTMNKSEVMLSESKPTLVPGRVIQCKNIQDEWNFEYAPNLLHTIIKSNGAINNTAEMQPNNKSRSDYILHIHVVEIKRPNSPLKTSITFSRRSISRLRQLTVHACSACANVFQTVQELNQHKNKCPINSNNQTDVKSDNLDIAMDDKSDVGEKRKLFDCSTCPAKNMNKRRYTRHLKSHFGPTNRQMKKPPPTNGSTLYQCKMCLVSFYHSATLSKHIKSQHLQGIMDLPFLMSSVLLCDSIV